MASSSSAHATSAAVELPPLPPKVYKPQRKGNIGAGKLDADEAAFTADVHAFELERSEQAALVKEHSGFKSGFESVVVSAAVQRLLGVGT